MKKWFLLTLFPVFILYSCQKDGITDISSYETLLNTDYENALKTHQSLLAGSYTNRNSHHPVSGTSNDTAYFKKLFVLCDSLFSEHFYEFCRDIAGSGDMMGNPGMNGMGMMDHQFSIEEMIEYIDSVHMMNADYMKMDSLMFWQMKTCNMMTSATGNVETVFGKMQLLRKEHRSLH